MCNRGKNIDGQEKEDAEAAHAVVHQVKIIFHSDVTLNLLLRSDKFSDLFLSFLFVFVNFEGSGVPLFLLKIISHFDKLLNVSITFVFNFVSKSDSLVGGTLFLILFSLCFFLFLVSSVCLENFIKIKALCDKLLITANFILLAVNKNQSLWHHAHEL